MGYRDYSTVIGRIVDPNGKGDFTTIQSAIDAASADQTIFIRPGTYTENLTLKDGIILTASEMGTNVDSVTIVGKISASYAGSAALRNLTINTNGDFAIEVSGANATVLTVEECTLVGVANTILSYTSSDSDSLFSFRECKFDVLTTGITAFVFTSAGDSEFNFCTFSNTGNSTTRSTCSAGSGGASSGVSGIPFTWSNGAGGAFNNFRMQAPIGTTEFIVEDTTVDFQTGCFFGGQGQNVAVLTINGTGTGRIGDFITFSTATNVIDGTGELIAARIYNYSSGGISITTTSVLPTYPRFAFSAALSADVLNVTGAGTAHNVVFDTVNFDIGNNYDNTTGTFTAPINGRYRFSTSISVINVTSAMTFGQNIFVATSGAKVGLAMNAANARGGAGTGADSVIYSSSVLISMQKGETCQSQIVLYNGAGNTADIQGVVGNTHFEGEWISA